MDTSDDTLADSRAERLLRLLVPLHEAPNDSSAWQEAFEAVAGLLRCAQLGLVEHEGEAISDPIGFGAGSDPRFIEDYRRHYVRINPLASESTSARLLSSSRPLAVSELIDLEAFRRTAYYTGYWSRYGLVDGALTARIVAGRRLAGFCALDDHERALDPPGLRLFALFADHCAAALGQRQELALRERALHGLSDATDALADALVLLDEHGLLLEGNARARELMAAGDPIQLHKGRLRLVRANNGDALPDLLRTARQGAGQAQCLALADGSGASHLLTAIRLGNGGSRRGEPVLALFIRSARFSTKAFSAEQLRELFRFTPAETRVANALLAGEEASETAQRLGVRTDTVRGHIKRMLAKTGTRRQSELVARLAGSVPMLRAMLAGGND